VGSHSLSRGGNFDVFARLLLIDLLERNGYRGFDGALDDTLDALRRAEPERHAVV
jgi:hypothetical protein